MNEQEQRIAIAEAYGLFKRPEGYVVEYRRWDAQCDGVFERVRNPDGSVGPAYRENLPDYLHDLNAMQEALQTLSANERVFFVACLFTVLGIDQAVFEREARPNDFYFAVITATAAQQGKAFLQAKGLCNGETEETK